MKDIDGLLIRNKNEIKKSEHEIRSIFDDINKKVVSNLNKNEMKKSKPDTESCLDNLKSNGSLINFKGNFFNLKKVSYLKYKDREKKLNYKIDNIIYEIYIDKKEELIFIINLWNELNKDNFILNNKYSIFNSYVSNKSLKHNIYDDFLLFNIKKITNIGVNKYQSEINEYNLDNKEKIIKISLTLEKDNKNIIISLKEYNNLMDKLLESKEIIEDENLNNKENTFKKYVIINK